MPPNRDFVPCPQCGEQIPFRWGECKRNANLVLMCTACGLNDLALNVLRTAVYERMKELGHTDLKPPTPLPIDPVTVFQGKDGVEVVIRRYKNGREMLYHRRAKRKPPR